MRAALTVWLVVAGCSESTIGSDAGGHVIEVAGCSAEAVETALAESSPGDVVRIGACEVPSGGFRVPAGVTVEGAGPAETVVTTGAATVIDGDSVGCTTIRGLRFVSDGPAAIEARGPGSICVEDVEVEATLGVAILVEGARSLTVRRATLTGPVTADNALAQPNEPDRETAATYALEASCVGTIDLEDVTARGWSSGGVAIRGSRLQWRGGSVRAGLGAGVLLHEVDAEISDVEISDMLQGSRVFPVYGLAADASTVTTSNLVVRNNEGVGVLQNGGSGEHVAGTFSANDGAGVWAQSGSLRLTGATVDANAGAGISTVGATSLTIEETVLSGTTTDPFVTGIGVVEVASGLFVIAHDAPVTLRGVRLEDNELTGAIFSLATPFEHSFVLEDVTVSPAETGVGVVGGPPPAGWEAGVSPPEATAPIPDPMLGDAVTPQPLPAGNPSC